MRNIPIISDTVLIVELFSFHVSIWGDDRPYEISWIVSRMYKRYSSKKLCSFLVRIIV